MDEPESLGAITLASREKLNNLIFVVNCNLQRLDGPVRGNSKVIQELEGACIFRREVLYDFRPEGELLLRLCQPSACALYAHVSPHQRLHGVGDVLEVERDRGGTRANANIEMPKWNDSLAGLRDRPEDCAGELKRLRKNCTCVT